MAYKVLIVDDDGTIRDSIAEYLASFGYSTDTAENAKSAIAMMHTARYDFVIMEVNLPSCSGEYSGRYLLNHIHYRYPGIKIIVVTGDLSIETGLEAIYLGASYWFTKPLSLAVLQNRISLLISMENVRSLSQKQGKGHSI